MTKPLMARVSAVVSASLTSLVEHMEDAAPERAMKSAIREIEGLEVEIRAELIKLKAQTATSRQQIKITKDKIVDLSERAKLALDEGRQDLAEVAMGRVVDLEAQLPSLQQVQTAAETKEADYTAQLAALSGRKADMERDLETYLRSRKEVDADNLKTKCDRAHARVQRADDAVDTFKRVFSNASGVARADEPDSETRAKLGELEALVRTKKIEERLQAIRKTA